MPNNLTLTSPTYTTGTFGNALLSNDVASVVAQVAGLLPTDLNMTIEVRGRPVPATGHDQNFIGQKYAFNIGVDSAGHAFASYGALGAIVTITSSAATYMSGAAHHFMLCISATSGAWFFVNGTLIGSSATTPATAGLNPTFSPMALCNINTEAPSGLQLASGGWVDEVAIWDSPLHTSGFTVPASAYVGDETGLVALWHLNSDGLDSKTAPSDTAAPTLTSPTAASTGTTTGSGTVTTNEANGTLYSLATTNATETAATIKASGATQSVIATGLKNVTFSSLTASTTYYAHYVHRDAAGNDSTPSNSSSFTTSAPGDTTAPVISSPTATQTGSTTASGTVSTNEANGAMYRYASTNATETAATIKAANVFSAVTATGSQAAAFTGLTPSTAYYAHYLHRDAAGNDSNVVNSASFTTAAATAAVFTQPLPMKGKNGGLRLGVAVRATVSNKDTDAVIGTVTGLTTNATTALLPPFSLSGAPAGSTYAVKVTNIADPTDYAVFNLAPA